MCAVQSDVERKENEISCLADIYGREFEQISICPSRYKVVIDMGNDLPPVILSISLPEDYPNKPPRYELHFNLENWQTHTFVSETSLASMINPLMQLHDPDNQCNLVRAIEWVRENAPSYVRLPSSEDNSECVSPNQRTLGDRVPKEMQSKHKSGGPLPTIFHGSITTNKKSRFQAHLACAISDLEVNQILEEICTDKKIASATHPCIYAVRLQLDPNEEPVEMQHNGGEAGAAQRLMHILHTRKIKNILIVVTRWFGGTMLGPDRFREITASANTLLNLVFLNTEEANSQSLENKPIWEVGQHLQKEGNRLRVGYRSSAQSDIQECTLRAFQTRKIGYHQLEYLKRETDEKKLWERQTGKHIRIGKR
ncbi:protein IMPACT-like [Schistocerca gregaria]|uniref:protein IMPACT-like n=1 Tax=Schistocerca gregaria TaxID=7010 RepID=UPI00211DC6A0|nr:protein IMPACT-like [Schistocerca gregaria]